MSGSDRTNGEAKGDKNKRIHEVKQIAANVYEIQFQKTAKSESKSAAVLPPAKKPSSRVLKAEDLRSSYSDASKALPKVNPYIPSRVASEVSPKPFEKQSPETTVGELKRNLNSLKDMHLRLRVMLKELEEFVQS